jgi:hypothetical protein
MHQQPVRPTMTMAPISSQFIPESAPEYSTKEEAEKAFFGLLKETVSWFVIRSLLN